MHSIQHFMKHYSYRPYVRFSCVIGSLRIGKVYLWSHCVLGPTLPALNLKVVSEVLSQTKVRNLRFSIFDEYILKLQVTMDDIFRLQQVDPKDNLFEIAQNLLKIIVTLLEFFLEVALAILKNDVAFLIVLKVINNFDDVLRIQLLEAFKLIFLEIIHLFGGYFFAGVFVYAQPHNAIRAFSEYFVEDDHSVVLKINFVLRILFLVRLGQLNAIYVMLQVLFHEIGKLLLLVRRHLFLLHLILFLKLFDILLFIHIIPLPSSLKLLLHSLLPEVSQKPSPQL